MIGWPSFCRFRLASGYLAFLRVGDLKRAAGRAEAGSQWVGSAFVDDVAGIPGYGLTGSTVCAYCSAVPSDDGAIGEAAVSHGGVFGWPRRQALVADGRIAAGAMVVMRLWHGGVSGYGGCRIAALLLDSGLWMPSIGRTERGLAWKPRAVVWTAIRPVWA